MLYSYCQDDLACVCVMCYIADYHKGHRIITRKEAFNQGLVGDGHCFGAWQA